MDPASQVRAIDEGIIQSEARIQREVAEYLALHPSRVCRQLAEGGIAKIPTFAGDYILLEADLRAIVSSEK